MPVVLVGDGAFQMRAGLATLPGTTSTRWWCLLTTWYGRTRPCRTAVHDSGGNTIGCRRFWAGPRFVVETEQELDNALVEAKRWTKSFCLLEVRLAPLDARRAGPPGARMASGCNKRNYW